VTRSGRLCDSHGWTVRARPEHLASLSLTAVRSRLTPALALAVAAGSVASAAIGAPPIPTPIGVSPAYRLAARGPSVAAARPVGALVCSPRTTPRFGVHVELFARKLVLLLPAGIGIAPPLQRERAFVVRGRCSYPLRTREPTGVIEVAEGTRLDLGQLFQVWGQPLSRDRLAGFRAAAGQRVLAFVDGRRYSGDPRTIPLRRHAEIVLEIGGYVPPHTSYLFPKGLS
jgi:hypothetical protein